MPDLAKNVEISKYWTFNQTGNIMVSSTVQEEKDLREAVITEFQKVSVLYDAISTAIVRKKLTHKVKDPVTGENKEASLGLFDYDAITQVMAASGFFALIHEEDRKFTNSSSSTSIDVAMIGEILADFSGAGPVMDIAKNVIRSMGGAAKKLDLSASSENKSVRIGHLLFICEDCMGMPLVNVQVISTSLDQLAWIVTTPCSSTSHTEINMEYKMETFMFIDPAYIAKFSHEFKASPDFEDLITRMSTFIPDSEKTPLITGILLDDGKTAAPTKMLKDTKYWLVGKDLGETKGSLRFAGGKGTIEVSAWAPDKIEFHVIGPVKQAAAIEVHAPNDGTAAIVATTDKYTVDG